MSILIKFFNNSTTNPEQAAASSDTDTGAKVETSQHSAY